MRMETGSLCAEPRKRFTATSSCKCRIGLIAPWHPCFSSAGKPNTYCSCQSLGLHLIQIADGVCMVNVTGLSRTRDAENRAGYRQKITLMRMHHETSSSFRVANEDRFVRGGYNSQLVEGINAHCLLASSKILPSFSVWNPRDPAKQKLCSYRHASTSHIR